MFTLLDVFASLRRGYANIICIAPILTDDPRRESTESAVFCMLAESLRRDNNNNDNNNNNTNNINNTDYYIIL